MPCANITEAVDDMMALVNTTWEADVVPLGFQSLSFDDTPTVDRPADTVAGSVVGWGKAHARHATGQQAALAADGSARSRWERQGTLTIEVFSPQGNGRVVVDQALQALLDGLEGAHTANGVWFRNVRIAETGQSGVWYLANVLADFEYDQVK